MGNAKPRILILSASERIDVATALQSLLDFDHDATVWTQGIFKPGQTAYDSFRQAVEQHAYGVFVLTPDDVLTLRGKELDVPRINVIFELGYFAGQHGIERAFFLTPRGAKFDYLSDLAGFQAVEFDYARFQRGEEESSLGSAARTIRAAIQRDRIEFPDTSHRRPNILAAKLTEIAEGGDYCLAANLKAGQEIRLVISGLPRDGQNMSFGWTTSLSPSRIAWDHSIGIVGNKQTYRASGAASAFTQFSVGAACSELTVRIFENDAALDEVAGEPIRTIVLKVVPAT